MGRTTGKASKKPQGKAGGKKAGTNGSKCSSALHYLEVIAPDVVKKRNQLLSQLAALPVPRSEILAATAGTKMPPKAKLAATAATKMPNSVDDDDDDVSYEPLVPHQTLVESDFDDDGADVVEANVDDSDANEDDEEDKTVQKRRKVSKKSDAKTANGTQSVSVSEDLQAQLVATLMPKQSGIDLMEGARPLTKVKDSKNNALFKPIKALIELKLWGKFKIIPAEKKH